MMCDGEMIALLVIQEMDTSGIGGVAVGNKGNFLFFCGSAGRLVHSNNGRLCSPVIRHVVGGNFQVFGRDEEKDEMMLSQDLDVGFIACGDGVDRTFMSQVEPMAIERRGGGIVEHRLVGDVDPEDGLHNGSGFPGGDGEGDVEG